MSKKKIIFKGCVGDELTAYIYLPNHPPGSAKSKKTVHLYELLKDYVGPDIIFDFDKHNELIGIEILA